MNLLINIHKDSPDVVVIVAGDNITRTTMTKDELIEFIKDGVK
jgi:hypothetical protein